MRHPHLLWLICCLLLTAVWQTAPGQRPAEISGDFEGYSFSRLVEQIEARTPYRLFYDSTQTDSLVIHVSGSHLLIRDLLDLVFRQTDFHYAIDPEGRIFVIRKFPIQSSLPPHYFDPGNPSRATGGVPEELNGPEDAGPVKDRLKVSPENKLFDIGSPTARQAGNRAVIAGYLRDVKSGEPIIGATVYVDSPAVIATTDQFGYYSLSLPRGKHLIKISAFGMKPTRRQVILHSDGKLNIELQEYVASLKAVVVTAEKGSGPRSIQMGVNRLTIKTIKQVPVVFGEADVLKVVLTLPGVTSVGESSNGFNVRGGSTDQNLILFNDATIYNPSHLFGFFSAFNPDVVKGIELYKSAIPEKYGGRLSSVLDVSIRDGNNKKWSGSAGIGPLTSKITLEGPIKKEKTSLIAAVRTTYSDWLLKAIPDNSYSKSSANFYDVNFHLTHIANARNTLYLTGYLSQDRFNLNNDTTYKYANKTLNLKWKHIFNNSLFAVLTAGVDHYQYAVSSTQNPVNAYQLGFDISQLYVRADFSYAPSNRHTFSYGLNTMRYQLNPGSFNPIGPRSLIVQNTVPTEQALESALYLGDQYSVSSNLSVNAGIRYSLFNYLGPHDVYNYSPGLPRETVTLQDTSHYPGGKAIKTYHGPEFRFSMRYTLSDNASLKFSFNTLQQYIHLLSNTTTISPTDIWKLSDPHIAPQQGNQLSLGYYHNFRSNMFETSVEVYYKQLHNYLDYKSGASLVLNHHIETDVFTTRGKAYGIELLVKKTAGKVNGWLSYTFSRTFLKQDDPLAGELINGGRYYPASFDKPHNLNFIGNYRFSHRYSLSVNLIYSTGRPITIPIAVYNVGGSSTLYYSERNQYRIPDYFRSDISVNLDGNHRVKQKTHNSWSAGIYNVTGRQNAYSVYFIQENGKVKGYQLSIFGTLIPFVTYNIKF